MRHVISLSSLSLIATLLAGCGGATSATTPSTQIALPDSQSAVSQSAILRSRWMIDLDALTGQVATVAPDRSAAQSELYSLSIGAFSNPNTIKITGVERGPDALLIRYTTTHPFRKAADLSAPATAANREDLAISGRVVFLLDGFEEFFGGTVTADTAMILDPDGYVTPGEMIDTSLLNSNTFPYQLLVDEAQDNRVGLSNAGSVTGNYNPATGGWQVAEFTSGITGFDILGQGQTSSHSVAIDIPSLEAAGQLSFDAVILAKYEDPRGGTTATERRANRLPVGDVARFAYRMPHGALDVSRVIYNGESGGLVANTLSSTTLNVLVRDWDARLASESAGTNLASETDVSLVSAGESGIPTVEISLPGFNDFVGPLPLLDNSESGQANDEFVFEGDFTNTIVTGQPANGGTEVGLVRVTDVTDITPPLAWANINRFNLRPDLSPITTVVEGQTYQRFTVELAPPVFDFGCPVSTPVQTAPTGVNPFPIAGRFDHNAYNIQPHTNWQQFTFRALDAAAMADVGRPGVVLQGRSLFSGANSDFYRFYDVPGWQAERMTNFSATPIRQANQVEIDSTNRVLWCQVNNAYTQNTTGLKFTQSLADIKYFDWNGTMVTGPIGTITTAPNIPLAMALDPDDNVYIIDKTQVLRKYEKANNYAQVVTAPYPKILPFAPGHGSQGDVFTMNIHDFVINPHNAAFYILGQTNAQPATVPPGNGYLYRVECNGNINAFTPAGTANPQRFVLNPGDFNDGVADITIDYRNSVGAILPDAGDVQIIVMSHTDFGNTEPDIRIFDSELRFNLSATLDFQDGDIFSPAFAPATGTMDMLQNQLYIQPEYSDADYHWYNAPAGWE